MFNTIPFTSIHSNLEHGLAILTESFSLLRPVLHNMLFLSVMHAELAGTGLLWPQPTTLLNELLM